LRIVETPEVDVGAQPVIAAIGTFDGVHLGHMQLFETALDIKAATGLPVMAAGFHPHPKSLVKSGNDYEALLTPLEEKQALLEDMGLDYFWAIPFTREVSQLSPREFTHIYLRNKIRAEHIVCGFNFAFGYKRQGNPQVLRKLGQEMGFEVSVVPPYTIDGEVVSSTKVRQLLSQGDAERAAALLGRPYCIYGPATKGQDIYMETGIPAWQVLFPADKFLPKNGVYAVWARASKQLYPAVVSLGTSLEVHIPIFARDLQTVSLQGEGMQLFFMKHIKGERRFESRVHREKQMKTDLEAALAVLKPHGTAYHDRGLFTPIGAYDRIFSADIP
jgi:riboflavin kinase/FMN adenylyltransferase